MMNGMRIIGLTLVTPLLQLQSSLVSRQSPDSPQLTKSVTSYITQITGRLAKVQTPKSEVT